MPGVQILDVYHANLHSAMSQMTQIAQKYKCIGVDSEFPGYFQNIEELGRKLTKQLQGRTNYEIFRNNIDNLKIIQIGFAFCDENGNFPNPAVFQFNFDFNFDKEIIQEQSKSFLKEHFKEIQLKKLREISIHPSVFSAMFAQSGLLANPELTWFCFHGNQDLGYFIKTLTLAPLPSQLPDFRKLIKQMFPTIYDMKIFMKWDLGLSYLADVIGVTREGIEHNAGSDAYVTLKIAIISRSQWANEGEIFGLSEDQINVFEQQE